MSGCEYRRFMQSYPHHYTSTAAALAAGSVTISAPGLPSLETAPPPQFDGPAGFWSPETLLTAAVADCFVLTFRAVARAARFDWIALECRVTGKLERTEGQSRFTHFETSTRLTVPPGSDAAKARRLLEQAEHGCLVANSLRAERTLLAEVIAEIRSVEAVQSA